jgi:hypothetical protein
VKVQGALRLAGGAAGEGNQAHVIAGGGVADIRFVKALHACFKPGGRVAVKQHHLLQAGRVLGVSWV